MSRRLDRGFLIFASIEDETGGRCVDLFERPDASCGFEEFRRDVEDRGVWTPVQSYSAARFQGREAASAAAARTVPWFADALAAQRLRRR